MTVAHVKPVLGYSTTGAACLALKAQGKTWAQVGEILGMKENTVSALACRARKRAAVRTFEMDGLLFYDCEREARRRDMPVNMLIHQIIKAIVHDSLFSAVLDI